MAPPHLGIPLSLARHSRGLHTSPRGNTARSIASIFEQAAGKGEWGHESIKVNGRVRSVRAHKERAFASIGDGTTLQPLQVVLKPQDAENLSTGTGVTIFGQIHPAPRSGAPEIHVTKLDIVAQVEATTYPMQKKTQKQGHTVEYLRTIPHMRVRHPFTQVLMKFQSQCEREFSAFYNGNNFTKIHTPILTSSDCEAGGETFTVSGPASRDDDGTFFKTKKYLTVSHQLELEAMAQSIEKVWSLSPTFRAERSDTARHLSEFYMLEVEQTYVESWRDPMETLKNSICHVTRNLYSSKVADAIIHGKRSEGPEEEPGLAGKLEERWQGMMQCEWPQISYTKAISLLEQHANRFEHRPEWGLGLKSEHENFIAKHVGKGSPVFITHYPKAIKPFYMLKAASNVEETRSVVHNFDLVVPEVCEIAGGSLREHDLETLIKEMQSMKMLPEGESSQLSAEDFGNYKDYIDLRRWGYIPSGGFGLGFDRLIMYLTGIPNIREVIRYPRSFRH